MAFAKKKFVKVTSQSEIEMEPDRVEFCVKITTNRKELAEAKESVKKRRDFVISAIKKFKISDEDVTEMTICRRHGSLSDLDREQQEDNEFFLQLDAKSTLKKFAEYHSEKKSKGGDDGGGGFTVEKERQEKLDYSNEITVKCDSLIKYLKVFSICNEKLDRHVFVSQPVVRFTPAHLQNNTEKAVREAMRNGVAKGLEMLGALKQRYNLGRLYYSVEDSLSMEDTAEYLNNSEYETFAWKRLNKIIKCNLTSVFELEYVKIRKVI